MSEPPAAGPAYAGFWLRALAAVLDFFAIILPICVISFLLQLATPTLARNPLAGFLFNMVLPAAVTLGCWHWKGGTPGKRWLGLRIVNAADFAAPSFGVLFGRYFAYIVSMLPLFLGYLWVAWDGRKQGLHDKIAGTVVVQDEPGSRAPVWAIVLGAVFLVLLVLGAIVGAGAFWFWKNGDALKARGKQIKEEAGAFGKGKDAQACLDEALRRHDACGSFICQAENGVFLAETLKASDTPASYCDDVPPTSEMMKSALWRVDRCQAVGRSGDNRCAELFGGVQRYCEERRKTGGS